MNTAMLAMVVAVVENVPLLEEPAHDLKIEPLPRPRPVMQRQLKKGQHTLVDLIPSPLLFTLGTLLNK
jgi:hypothetical protein